ncbi:MAG: SpoIIE family protein phosphatase [Prolixibacteraceae bacterium]|nr:SpoIIE family protein phosphatase [Prolixibacteraceae bacterium]
MSQRGISFRLNSHVTAFAILIISAVVYTNHYFSNKILIEKIEEGAINQSSLVISRISRITVGTEEIARNVSYQALYYDKHKDLDFFLQQVVASNKILESIHVKWLDKDQTNFTASHSTGLCQQRCNPDDGFFNKSLESLSLGVWSKPFYCSNDTSHLLVEYRVPIYHPESTTIAGLVYCEISLQKMKQMLSEIKIGEKGYSFIINNEGSFITHPNDEWILHKNLYKNPPVTFYDDLAEIESKIRSGRIGSGYGLSEYLNNQKAWYYFAPLPNSKWTVIIVIPEKELFQKIELTFRKIILVSVVGILLLFVLNMLIFRKILSPLSQIANAIHHFTSLPGKQKKTKDEILILAESFEDWQAKYGLLIKEQSSTANEKRKFEKDLKSAREIQLNIIPEGKPIFPEHPEIDLSAVLKPAEAIGGDLYDYFFIDKDHLLVTIGDVSGKGIAASLFMAIASTLIKTHAKILSAKDLVSLVNQELSDRNSNQYFVTLFVGILDLRSGSLDYCNAAHNYPYILRPDGAVQILSKSHGLPLGIYKNKTYKNSNVDLKFGDVLLLYTDGVINSQDINDKHYGIEKLENNLHNLTDLSAVEVVERLMKSIAIYEGENKQADDITLVALKYLPKTENQA